MEIFNKSKRTFHLNHSQPTNENRGIHELKPEKTATVTDAEGAKLIKMYEGELIQVGNSQAEKENAELKAKVAELEEMVTAPEKVKKAKKS